MKKTLIVLLAILIIPIMRIAAQNPNLEKLNSYKIGFFTKKLNLTSEEAEKFWPVHNEYQKQKNLIQVEKFSLIRNFNQNESTLNDNQMTEIGDKYIAAIVQESTLAVTFHKKLKEVLPPEKVIRFYQAENQYKMQLLNELQAAKKQQRMPRRDL
jgi:DNA primase large subunit